MDEATCLIATCNGESYCRGWCRSHYERWRRHGDPLKVVNGLPLDERFLSQIVEDASGCLLWTGRRNRWDEYGYGILGIKINGKEKNVYAHRYAWERVHGPIPAGFEIDHMCYTKLCVLVAHLQMVTHQQNQENRSGAQRTSRSGVRGVMILKSGRYRAHATSKGRIYTAGTYDTKEEASAAAAALRNRLMVNNLADRALTER